MAEITDRISKIALRSHIVNESAIAHLRRLDNALKGYSGQLVLVIYNSFVKDTEGHTESYLKIWRLSVLTSPHICFSEGIGPTLPTSQYVQKLCTHENAWVLYEGNLLSLHHRHYCPSLLHFSTGNRLLVQLPIMYIGDSKIRRIFSRGSIREAMNLLRV